MARQAVKVTDVVASVNGSQANGLPIYVGGNTFSVQTIVDGGSLAGVEVSNDNANWVSVAATLGGAVTAVTVRPLWARGVVASDASAPRNNHFVFAVFKETED